MSITLEEVLNQDNSIHFNDEKAEHRGQAVTERPCEFVELRALTRGEPDVKKTQKEPTPDLVVIEKGVIDTLGEFYEIAGRVGYIIWCADTYEMWYAPTQRCLDSNFIYRDDLDIRELGLNDTELLAWYNSKVEGHNYGIVTCKKCYILDNPACETYEVYYNSNYPSLHYGKATPKGCYIHSYPNRFYRDMAILELDELYSNTSNKEAGRLTAKPMSDDEAIVISDGAWLKGTCACAYVYLDKMSVLKNVEGLIPSDSEQAVLIAEIMGAYNALMQCYMRKKTKITYYYDNTNIMGLFRSKRLAKITEIVQYKEFLAKLYKEGYSVTFVEIHPKTGENRSEENKALMFFHYQCDFACREMADIFKKDYKAFATSGNREGIPYSQINDTINRKKGNKPNSKWREQGNGQRDYNKKQ